MKPVPDATRRFTNRVDAYVRSRPRYPFMLADLLARETGLSPDHLIVDVGCGTGWSAEPFLRNGNRVIGLEPNGAMREAGARMFARYPTFRMVAGTAEALPLAAATADYIVAGQAYHWFDVDRARESFRQVLRPSGWAVVFWNTRLVDTTAFLAGYEALLLEFGTDYREIRERTQCARDGGAGAGDASGLRAFFGHDPERRVLPNAQELDLDGFRERVRSASYTPAEGESGYEPLMQAVERLFEAHQAGGRVALEYDLEVFFGRPAGGVAAVKRDRGESRP